MAPLRKWSCQLGEVHLVLTTSAISDRADGLEDGAPDDLAIDFELHHALSLAVIRGDGSLEAHQGEIIAQDVVELEHLANPVGLAGVDLDLLDRGRDRMGRLAFRGRDT